MHNGICRSGLSRRLANWVRLRASIALCGSLIIFAVGCGATYWPGLTNMAAEGQDIIARSIVTAPPETKLEAAEAILTHADKYDQLINRSTDPGYIAEARHMQRQEREAAAVLLRTAADEYLAQHNADKARTIYHFIVESFDQKEYETVSHSARSALASLGDRGTSL